jgi:hypothetical protein
MRLVLKACYLEIELHKPAVSINFVPSATAPALLYLLHPCKSFVFFVVNDYVF